MAAAPLSPLALNAHPFMDNPLQLSTPCPHSMETIMQVPEKRLALPQTDKTWSSWYVETGDSFQDFSSYTPPVTTPTAPSSTLGGSTAATSGSKAGAVLSSSTSFRTRSARQMSGQFEDEVPQSWEDDWEDEDADDTYDAIMGRIMHYATQEHQQQLQAQRKR